MILLDTHTLIWFLTKPNELSSAASKLIEKDYKTTPILISSMSIWEICHLIKKNKISFSVPLEIWFSKLNQKREFQYVPVDNNIAYRSQDLPGVFHADPADRIIVATAMITGATLITKDAKIRKYQHVKTIW